MSSFENFVHIEGNLATDPRHGKLNNGDAVVNLVVAMSDRVKVEGRWVDGNTSYIDVPVFGNLATRLDALTKGDRVTIEGKLRQRITVDKATGEKQYRVEVVAQGVSESCRFASTEASVNLAAEYMDEEPFAA